MYTDVVTTQDEAICHLFIHCCFKDGKFSAEEIDDVAEKFVKLNIHQDLNFKDELEKYRSYSDDINDEVGYLKYLIKQINPVHNLALYSYCVELSLSDAQLSTAEESLLKNIASILDIKEEQSMLDALFIQRKAVELEKIF